MELSIVNTLLMQFWPFKINLSGKLAGSINKKSSKVDKI